MTADEATQLSFDLPVRTALGREDFFVTGSNARAVAEVDGWQAWTHGKCLIAGRAGSGKTHLAHVWAGQSGASIVEAAALPCADIAALAHRHVCVEDVGRIAGDGPAENALFHLHNLVLGEGRKLLLTAAAPPAQLGLRLPDLASRLMGTQFVRLEGPDDALLGAVLLKLFADRQIRPLPTVVPFLVRRMPRSFDMARALVEDIDRAALAARREVTLSLARACLSRLESETADD